jgi:Zn-dependent peptidase ImmA (M78 family)
MTKQGSLFPGLKIDNQHRCNRDSIINAKEVDWMEWQAGYASGAFLMPYTPMDGIFHAFCSSNNVRAIVHPSSSIGIDLIRIIQKEFQVSEDAARVRLLKLNFLTDNPKSPNF